MSAIMTAPRRSEELRLRPEDSEEATLDGYALEVGRRIVQARKELNLTQVELARKIGVSQRSAQAYENGEVIPYRQMKALTRALKKTPEWVLHGEPEDGDRLARLEDKVDELTKLLRAVSRKL